MRIVAIKGDCARTFRNSIRGYKTKSERFVRTSPVATLKHIVCRVEGVRLTNELVVVCDEEGFSVIVDA